jgi:hypothetical protein
MLNSKNGPKGCCDGTKLPVGFLEFKKALEREKIEKGDYPSIGQAVYKKINNM